jgi:hypothetical protein
MGKVVYLILFGLIITTMASRMQIQRSATDSVINYVEKYNEQNVRNIANAAANKALNALIINVYETVGQTDALLYGGKYTYYFERKTQDPTLSPTQIRITAMSTYEDQKDTVIVLLTRPSFSRYAYFTNHEGNIWFATGDTLRGPTHTNTYFQMTGSPVFFGKVTSHQWYNANSPYREGLTGPTNPVFLGGTEWGIPEIAMPDEIPQETIDAAIAEGIYINNRYVWIEFQSDGTAKIAAKNSSTPPNPGQYTTYTLASTNGVIYIYYSSTRPLVRVKGTVNGQVTVATSGSMEITDNLVCAVNPMINPSSNDMLGLVAAKDIVVTNNQVNQDRIIQATIMTLNTSISNTTNFYVQDYNLYRYGYLRLYGGLIQNARGAVGLVGDAWSRKGYLKDYRWDQRLADMTPPHYPALFALRKIAWWD